MSDDKKIQELIIKVIKHWLSEKNKNDGDLCNNNENSLHIKH